MSAAILRSHFFLGVLLTAPLFMEYFFLPVFIYMYGGIIDRFEP